MRWSSCRAQPDENCQMTWVASSEPLTAPSPGANQAWPPPVTLTTLNADHYGIRPKQLSSPDRSPGRPTVWGNDRGPPNAGREPWSTVRSSPSRVAPAQDYRAGHRTDCRDPVGVFAGVQEADVSTGRKIASRRGKRIGTELRSVASRRKASGRPGSSLRPDVYVHCLGGFVSSAGLIDRDVLGDFKGLRDCVLRPGGWDGTGCGRICGCSTGSDCRQGGNATKDEPGHRDDSERPQPEGMYRPAPWGLEGHRGAVDGTDSG